MKWKQRLAKCLQANLQLDDTDEVSKRKTLDRAAIRHLRNIRHICGDLLESLPEQQVSPRHIGRRAGILGELASIQKKATMLENHHGHICWTKSGNYESRCGNNTTLCAIPKNLDELLWKDFWSNRVPVVLTSGTLSAAGDFSRIKRSLGLHRLPESRVSEVYRASPFDHGSNTLLYISEKVSFPYNRNMQYISAVADEVERLIHISHGHAAVLFTSYDAMGRVYTLLDKRKTGFPMFRMGKSDVHAVEKFKYSGKGVLFASGSLWEGIDIPGDALSMLIIVRLPFAAPDPVSNHERTQYSNFEEYKRSIVVPEMLIKLKQGFGRLIRTETDTGVVALLDCRGRKGGPYHEEVVRALPRCPITSDFNEISAFLRSKKSPGYFA